MRTKKIILELEQLIEKMGYRIRKEKGDFKDGFCVLEGEKIVMINKNYSDEHHIAQIIRFLDRQDLEQFYVKPAVRKIIADFTKKIHLNGDV